jgi:serine/threonine-protein kinase
MTVDDPLSGRIFAGKYEVEERIGAGSMGMVYRARHVTLDKVVAVKVLHHTLASDPNVSQRFQREARAASRLKHPCSVHVLDYGREADGTLYIAMEFIDGIDLYDLMLANRPLPPERVVSLMTQTLSALAAAHDVGVLHRDLKPENIMITTTRADDGKLQEQVTVCDFGVAQIADPNVPSGRRLTAAGFIIGTPDYMSPEQARGQKVDERSDLYSAGVIMFQLLTGRLPFEADTPIDVALKQITEAPPQPRDLYAGVDPVLEAICLRAMRKTPSERYATARAMMSALRDALVSRSNDAAMSVGCSLDGACDDRKPTIRETPNHSASASLELPPPLVLQLIPPQRSSPSSRRATRTMIVMALLAIACTGIVRRQQLRTVALDIGTGAATRVERHNDDKPTLDTPPASPILPAALAQPAVRASPAPAGSLPGALTSRPSRSSPEVIQKPKPGSRPVKLSRTPKATLSHPGATRASTQELATPPASDAEPAIGSEVASAPVELDDEPVAPER